MPDPGLFPIAGELEGALADWLGEGLVRGDGGETFARRLALGSQTVEQTQGLTSGCPRVRNDQSKTSIEASTNIATAVVCLQILSEVIVLHPAISLNTVFRQPRRIRIDRETAATSRPANLGVPELRNSCVF